MACHNFRKPDTTVKMNGFNRPWNKVVSGKAATESVNRITRIPKGSKGKYEMDKATGPLWLNRILLSAVHYPSNYGFIPGIYCADPDGEGACHIILAGIKLYREKRELLIPPS